MPSPLNRSIRLSAEESKRPVRALPRRMTKRPRSGIYCGLIEEALCSLPQSSFDLIIADPPYNFGYDFGNRSDRRSEVEYRDWVRQWIPLLLSPATPVASFYICSPWQYSGLYQEALSDAGLTVINRITWRREKGRGSSQNWKQNMEDIWYAVRDKKRYTFNLEQVKIRKQVIAPYRENGVPKDWKEDSSGERYRMTHPSNIWTDLTVPFWSMPENTPHPTQKPEALVSRIIEASSNPGDAVLDLFSGSGTTSVVAKKLGRRFVGVEMNPEFVRYGLKRLQIADGPSRSKS